MTLSWRTVPRGLTLRLRLSCLTTLPETEQYPDVEEQQDEERGEEVGHCGEDHHVEAVHRVLSEGNATPRGLYQPHPSVMKKVHLQRRLINFLLARSDVPPYLGEVCPGTGCEEANTPDRPEQCYRISCRIF